MLRAETWNELSEHGYRHTGESAVAPSPQELRDRPIVGIRAAFWLRWEPRTVREFVEDLNFGDPSSLEEAS
jgi:hypothetical protein